MLQVNEQMIHIGTDKCQLLKKDGHILVRVPSYGWIPEQEIAIKLKGTMGHKKVTPVSDDSDCSGSKFVPPKPYAE